jgi:hypothetical protein
MFVIFEEWREHQWGAWHCFFVSGNVFMKYAFIHSLMRAFCKIITAAQLYELL